MPDYSGLFGGDDMKTDFKMHHLDDNLNKVFNSNIL